MIIIVTIVFIIIIIIIIKPAKLCEISKLWYMKETLDAA